MFRIKSHTSTPVIDLTGPQGNAFVLIGYAKTWAKQLNMDWPALQKELMSSDYETLLNTLEHHFGNYVIFERN